jgi:hypothetical protein
MINFNLLLQTLLLISYKAEINLMRFFVEINLITPLTDYCTRVFIEPIALLFKLCATFKIFSHSIIRGFSR